MIHRALPITRTEAKLLGTFSLTPRTETSMLQKQTEPSYAWLTILTHLRRPQGRDSFYPILLPVNQIVRHMTQTLMLPRQFQRNSVGNNRPTRVKSSCTSHRRGTFNPCLKMTREELVLGPPNRPTLRLYRHLLCLQVRLMRVHRPARFLPLAQPQPR